MPPLNTFQKTCIGLAIGQFAVANTHAAIINVNVAGDNLDTVNGGNCTLRKAVLSMNDQTLRSGCQYTGAAFGNDDTIIIDPSLSDRTITLQGQELTVGGNANAVINTTIQGNGITIDANNRSRAFNVDVGDALSINEVAIVNGQSEVGGAILVGPDASLTLTDAILSNNEARNGSGGAIIARRNTHVMLLTSTVSNNSARSNGGGIYIFGGSSRLVLYSTAVSGNSSNTDGVYDTVGKGGGISVNSAALELHGSTVSGNSAVGSGGGIFNESGTTTAINSTISMNLMTVAAGTNTSVGSGVSQRGGRLTLTNTTVSGNREVGSNAFVTGVAISDGQLSLNNSMIIGNQPSSVNPSQVEIALFGAASRLTRLKRQDSNFNLLPNDENTFIGFTPSETDIRVNVAELGGLDQILLPLNDNGGPTLTHALPAGSPAINAADSAVCAESPTNNLDQRGAVRDEQCDIGAFEFGASIPEPEPEPEPDGTFFVVPTKNGKFVIVEL